ncbi:major facilitator superfamily MFS_1 [candidate division TM7 genomosp. GTL1]|nr:major facilitator superfamily MFS_1 [candidate division TM7 genomosp. GTL1]
MRRAFVYFAFALGLFIAAASAPSPLYGIFQAEWHFSSLTLTLIFAVYAFALLLALLFCGSLSDYVGRRPMLFTALVIEAIGMIVFAVAPSVGWLYVARLLQGIATGIATAVLSASLIDTQPQGRTGLAPLVSTITPVVGLGIGAFVSGLLVSYAVQPTHLIFWLLFGCMATMMTALYFVSEPTKPQPGWKHALLPTIALPKAARKPLIVSGPSLVACWALVGLYLSVSPSVATGIFGGSNHLISGLIITALTIAAACASYILRNNDNERLLITGAYIAIIGLAVTSYGIAEKQIGTLFVGTIVAGTGFGPAFTDRSAVL